MPSEYSGFRTIAWEWDEVVCSCEDPTYALADNTICTRCKKMARWQLIKCAECNIDYIYSFRHHARTYTRPAEKGLDGLKKAWALDKRVCWNCICKDDPAVEGDIPPKYTEPPRVARSLADIGLGDISFDL